MTGTRAVVFDFDGVLADTERLHLAAFQDAFSTRGWHLDEASYFAKYLGFDDRDVVGAVLRDQHVSLDAATVEALLQLKAARYRERLGAGQAIFAGAPACVRRLAVRYRLGVASGSRGQEIAFILDAGGLSDAFSTIVGADDVARSKPAPDVYVEAVRRLGVPPAEAVAVEDSPWGLTSARSAGLATVAVTTSYPASELAAADAVIESLDELTETLIETLDARR